MSINFSNLKIKSFLTENMQNRIFDMNKDDLSFFCSNFWNKYQVAGKDRERFFDFLDYGSKNKESSFKIIKFLIGEYGVDKLNDLPCRIPEPLLEQNKFLNKELSNILSKILKSGNTIHDNSYKASEKLKLLKLLFLSENNDRNKINDTIDNINFFHSIEKTGIKNMLNRVNKAESNEISKLSLYFWQDNNIRDEDKEAFIKLFNMNKLPNTHLDFIKFLIGEYKTDRLNKEFAIPKSLLDANNFLNPKLSQIFAMLLKSRRTVHDSEEKAQKKLKLLFYIMTPHEEEKKEIVQYFDSFGFDNKIIFSKEKGVAVEYKTEKMKFYYFGHLKNAIPNSQIGEFISDSNSYKSDGIFKYGQLTLGNKIFKNQNNNTIIEEQYVGTFRNDKDNKILNGKMQKSLGDGNVPANVKTINFDGEFKDGIPYKGELVTNNYIFNGVINRKKTQVEFSEMIGELQFKDSKNKVFGKIINDMNYKENTDLEHFYSNLNIANTSVMYSIIENGKTCLYIKNSKIHLKSSGIKCSFTGVLDEKGNPFGRGILEFEDKIITAQFKDGKVVESKLHIFYKNSFVEYDGKVNDNFEPCENGTYVINKNQDKLEVRTRTNENRSMYGKYIFNDKKLIKEVKGYFDYQKLLKSITNNQNNDYYDLLENDSYVDIVFIDGRVLKSKFKGSLIKNDGIKLMEGQMFFPNNSEVCFGKFNYLNGAREGYCEIIQNILENNNIKIELISSDAKCVLIKSGNFKNDFFYGENITRIFYKDRKMFKEFYIDNSNSSVNFNSEENSITKIGNYIKYKKYSRQVEFVEIERFYINNDIKMSLKPYLKKYERLSRSVGGGECC